MRWLIIHFRITNIFTGFSFQDFSAFLTVSDIYWLFLLSTVHVKTPTSIRVTAPLHLSLTSEWPSVTSPFTFNASSRRLSMRFNKTSWVRHALDHDHYTGQLTVMSRHTFFALHVTMSPPCISLSWIFLRTLSYESLPFCRALTSLLSFRVFLSFDSLKAFRL